MIGKRLQQLRLARGLSLEGLSAELGGIVTKQAISKYETGKANPNPIVLIRLAQVFGVKAAHLAAEPTLSVEFPGYRKRSTLSKKERGRLESLIAVEMEQRVRLQDLVGTGPLELPVQALRVDTLDDVEQAANELRRLWDLGGDPIAGLIETLESHRVHVLEVEAASTFDGISTIVRDDQGTLQAVGAVTRRWLSGERQRLNIAHELGHLVLKFAPALEEESAAFRFAAAFLAPGETVRRDIGTSRTYLQTEELQFLRRRYGISMQASLRRLFDLSIITEAIYKQWCINFSRWGWRKQEPGESQPEKPEWYHRTLVRAVAEGLITAVDAEAMSGEKFEQEIPLALLEKRAFMKLPMAERRRILERQAILVAAEYNAEIGEGEVLGGRDFIDDY